MYSIFQRSRCETGTLWPLQCSIPILLLNYVSTTEESSDPVERERSCKRVHGNEISSLYSSETSVRMRTCTEDANGHDETRKCCPSNLTTEL